MATVTPAQALRHPNWSMGPKITIDSATLMNKGLELIEAHHLFVQPAEKLDVLVHPQSTVHGLVHFEDGSVIAALSPPDMRSPIAHCLAWPERIAADVPRLDLAAIGQLTFERADFVRFPALRIAREALDLGGWATNILSAANEIAVEAFLANRIGFLEIARIGEQAISEAVAAKRREPASLDEAIALDEEGRRIARRLVSSQQNQRKFHE
jgi:1-deoxy-D-xylulose-5-phosphate reductoisomerase